ncbi:DUF3179 domain-containing (seleno)protein [Flavihumibacter solisilvae]|uniref:DUF3179 domain-containing protein n=1 Tax=Flavihumibacter solisilvae TaxID=1349421 RepID=A0A0C1IZD0_9BACT|nr:DUF3179 domain-containing (seleno)protein [Flavihumibacter solisilvae]KIC95864.1 hypothetical protein OI18_04350 [Flavihumibacter solisilvae]
MRRSLLFLCILLLFVFEIARVYLIMPFPGSQKINTVGIAYWLHHNITWIRLFLLVSLAILSWVVWRKYGKPARILTIFSLVAYVVLFYFFNYRFQADTMFHQPSTLSMVKSGSNKIAADRLVIGVSMNGEAKAYPVQLIGYHHQVRDTIGNVPVMITYCTVCRTGRVFSPEINGRPESFRLVGMDHFNAMFEDGTTGSWWQQATGRAIAGPLAGQSLREIPSRQASLQSWLAQYPEALVMQPDSNYLRHYKDLEAFDKGTISSSLEKRDSGSWKFKSWVLGVKNHSFARAYDWNLVLQKKLIEDSAGSMPLLIVVEKDSASFHAWNRSLEGRAMHFSLSPAGDQLQDLDTHSSWNMDGLCIDGPLKGNKLQKLQAYQEFWHSWRNFNPNTTRYQVE